jgi:hypothetical protein
MVSGSSMADYPPHDDLLLHPWPQISSIRHHRCYIRQPKGFDYTDLNDPDIRYVLKLNKALYGLKQAPCHFFNHLKDRLKNIMSVSPLVTLASSSVKALSWLCMSMTFSIDKLIKDLHDDVVWIRKEGSAEGFLGVDIQLRDDGSLSLSPRLVSLVE